MSAPDFYHSARLLRAARNRLLLNLLGWAAAIAFLYGIGAAAAHWMAP